jgi:UDP-GlcNAc:undecaprenyl-phosphate GlcNAc-1-phosphate transferase
VTSAVALAVAALATYLATPAAIALAHRTAFYDHPAGYKGHAAPTPCLGGIALLLGIVAGFLSSGGSLGDNGVLLGCAVCLGIVGTVDDKVSVPIVARLLIEVLVAGLLWDSGHGWTVFHSDVPDLLVTLLWVVGVVNAFNLMDNMDGAAATSAAVSSIGAGVLALVSGLTVAAPLCFAIAGACISFLPRNLARPARIFMGDGGSLPIGLLVAGVAMEAVNRRYLGPSGVVVGALLVALVILDTTLVTFSRTRAGRPVLSGGRDHLTHRLVRRLESPRHVALALACTQFVVSSVTIAVAQAGVGWVLLAAGVLIALGAGLIWQFEGTSWLVDAPLTSARPDSPAAVPVEEPGIGLGGLALTAEPARTKAA